MANSYTTRLKKRLPAIGDVNWDDEWHDNEKIDEVVAGALLSVNRVISGGTVTAGVGLDVDYAAAVALLAGARLYIAGGTLPMTAAQAGQQLANWLYINSSGVVTASTTPPSGDYIPLAQVDTDSISIVRIADLRPMAAPAKPPIVILATGQSNMLISSAYAWTPAPNLHVWNFDATTQASSEVGTAFVAPSSAVIGISIAAGQKIAVEHPDVDVYVINIAVGNMALINWSATPPAPPTGYNFREAIAGNVPVALADIGVTKIDCCVWGGAESDALAQSTTIATNMESYLYDWLSAQSWYPLNTRMFVMPFSPYAESSPGNGDFLLKRFCGSLRYFAAIKPYIREYIDLEDFPISLYSSAGAIPYIHKTGDGYYQSGLRLGDAILRGTSVPYLSRENNGLIYTPVITNQVNCTVTVSNAYWQRIWNTITVCATLSITKAVAGNATNFDMSIPVKTMNSAPAQVSGNVGSILGGTGIVGTVTGTQTIRVFFYSGTSAADTAGLRFSYRVLDCDILPNSP